MSAIESSLARATGKQVRCGYTVDESLVGGVTVRVGSTMYDGSVRGQLDGLRRRLTSES
jgi:F-type H+-transporting ATPase subunit delta